MSGPDLMRCRQCEALISRADLMQVHVVVEWQDDGYVAHDPSDREAYGLIADCGHQLAPDQATLLAPIINDLIVLQDWHPEEE